MPDEMAALAVLDSALLTERRRMCVDIAILPGMRYASSMFWDGIPHGYEGAPWREHPGGQKPLPPLGTRLADILWDVDVSGFEKPFVRLMTWPR